MKYQDRSLAGNITHGQEKWKTHVLNYNIIRVMQKRVISRHQVDFHIDWGFVGSYLPPLEIIGCGKVEKKSPSDWLPPEEAFLRYFLRGQMWVLLLHGSGGGWLLLCANVKM